MWLLKGGFANCYTFCVSVIRGLALIGLHPLFLCVCVFVCVFSITSIKFYLLLLSSGAGVGHPPGVVCVFVSAVACSRPAQTCNSPAVTWAISSYSKPITAEL